MSVHSFTSYSLVLLAALFLLQTPLVAQDTASEPAAEIPAGEVTQTQLERLIDQLGADEFSARQAAKAELAQLGLAAFDALFEAQDNPDIEIALAARFLVRSMEVRWARESDPEEVRRILGDYRSQSAENRRNLMHRLAELENGMGIQALCRLVRYESDASLAKQAALLLLETERPEQKETARKWAATIEQTVGSSRRAAADWARAYAHTLLDPAAALPTWEQLIAAEHQALLRNPEKGDREVIRQLMRWHAELLLDLERREEALAVMRRSLNLVEADRRQLLDWIDWLILNQAPELVTELAARFEDTFSTDPELLYRLAETQLQQGLVDQANANAAQAREFQPENFIIHYALGTTLKNRELYEWAEQEYRVAIKNSAEGSNQNIATRMQLAEMLHDIQRDQAAGDVLNEFVTFAENNEGARQALENGERSLDEIRARMNVFYAAHAARNEQLDKAKEKLLAGYEADPLEIDLLISMYNLPTDDPQWKAKATAAVKQGIAHYRNEIEKYKKLAGGDNRIPLHRNSNALQWAMQCNQYAWLVSNTEGDYQDAIKQSHQSLTIRPGTGSYLDTLGRCYFAAGDLENAVKYQRQAVEAEPAVAQIQRQLELFEAELARQRKQN